MRLYACNLSWRVSGILILNPAPPGPAPAPVPPERQARQGGKAARAATTDGQSRLVHTARGHRPLRSVTKEEEVCDNADGMLKPCGVAARDRTTLAVPQASLQAEVRQAREVLGRTLLARMITAMSDPKHAASCCYPPLPPRRSPARPPAPTGPAAGCGRRCRSRCCRRSPRQPQRSLRVSAGVGGLHS